MRFARLAAASAAMTMVVGGFAASTSFAEGNPHFVQGPDYSIAANAVTATGAIAGLGTQDASIVLVADAEVFCVNHGNHIPKGLHRSVSSSPVIFSADHNGKVDFTVTTAALDAACPGKKMTPMVKFLSATLTATIGTTVLTDVHTF